MDHNGHHIVENRDLSIRRTADPAPTANPILFLFLFFLFSLCISVLPIVNTTLRQVSVITTTLHLRPTPTSPTK